MRNTEIRDTFANEYAYFDLKLEPKFQTLEGESFNNRTTITENEGWLDTKANSVLETRFIRAFFELKNFNPLAESCPRANKEA